MRSGFIAIVGRPNVGKSTMMNKLIEEKVAIVSNKSGTTRDRIKGIVNKGENQYIFMDTPGIHKPRHLLGEHMTNVALETLKGVDAIMFLLDGTQEISTGDEFVNDHVKAVNTPVVLVINKTDKMSDQEIQDKLEEIKEKLGDFDKIITIAAEYGIGMHKIYGELQEYLTSDVWYYPEDMYTDISINKMIREIVREKLLFYTKDEIPHSIAIEIVNIENTPKIAKYDINIYVERDSQKGIIIGKDGNLLKKVGSEARLEIEALLEKKVFLNLWVKVKKNWRKKKDFLKELGYDE
ncbi:GTPase Era [Sebaldella sp. S0638]|uniref:GTPase Era n=1 Tax=Sebaldella sp. S0638 TaxID=2957809 RepID=UPI00209E3538|nr:GTPase Era [Sebaldella sp. S0638]MCP1224562.1 GTPase Era [Sebaldella sp. S0638]